MCRLGILTTASHHAPHSGLATLSCPNNKDKVQSSCALQTPFFPRKTAVEHDPTVLGVHLIPLVIFARSLKRRRIMIEAHAPPIRSLRIGQIIRFVYDEHDNISRAVFDLDMKTIHVHIACKENIYYVCYLIMRRIDPHPLVIYDKESRS